MDIDNSAALTINSSGVVVAGNLTVQGTTTTVDSTTINVSSSFTFEGDAPIRLNKWMASLGICSRREAETLISQGSISVEGQKVTEPGHKIEPGQTMTLAGKATKEKIIQSNTI